MGIEHLHGMIADFCDVETILCVQRQTRRGLEFPGTRPGLAPEGDERAVGTEDSTRSFLRSLT